MHLYRKHRSMRRWFLILLCGVFLLQPVFVRAQESKDTAPDTRDSKFLNDTEISNPKVSAALQKLASRYAVERQPLAVIAEDFNARIQGERVQVQVRTLPEGQRAASAAMQAVGGDVTSETFDGSLLQGWLPVTAVAALATDPNVLFIEQPQEAIGLAGSAMTGGFTPLLGAAWHTLGHKGKNVKIAIVDFNFANYTASSGAGELPSMSDLMVKNFVDGETDADVGAGTTTHGTAAAEIVYDVAPEATIYLVKISTPVDVDQAVTWMIQQGITIVSSSIAFIGVSPGDGTGFLANVIQWALTNNILWVQAAGNMREYHWTGPYSDADNDGIHSFIANDNATESNGYYMPFTKVPVGFSAGFEFKIGLRWDDWTGAPTQNYDLTLCRVASLLNNCVPVAVSKKFQNGLAGQQPTEYLTYKVPPSEQGSTYTVRINRVSGNRPNVNLDLFAYTDKENVTIRGGLPRLQYRVFSSSLNDMADAPAAFTVGAVDAGTLGLEPYSAEGPILGPGGTPPVANPTLAQIKPDITAYANVATSVAPSFSGTSAAAPHVAGAAALVKGSHPTWSAEDIRLYLQTNAVDLGPLGKDNQTGFGRLQLGIPDADYFADFDNIQAPAANNAWTVNAGGTDTATSGQWAKGQPIQTTVNGSSIFQRGLNPSDPGPLCLVTGLLGGAWDANDVDGGITTMRSPTFAVPGGKDLTLSFDYYLAYDPNAVYGDFNKDYFKVNIGAYGDTFEAFSDLPASGWKFGIWQTIEVPIAALDEDTTFYIEIEAADSNGANVIEAAFDNVRLSTQ